MRLSAKNCSERLDLRLSANMSDKMFAKREKQAFSEVASMQLRSIVDIIPNLHVCNFGVVGGLTCIRSCMSATSEDYR